jgi:hypothetical protein
MIEHDCGTAGYSRPVLVCGAVFDRGTWPGERTYLPQSLPVVSMSLKASSILSDHFPFVYVEDVDDGSGVGLVELRRWCMSATGAFQSFVER